MPEEKRRAPRSVGSMKLSAPAYNEGSKNFALVVEYKCPHTIGEDEMISARYQAMKEFAKALVQHNFQRGHDPHMEIDIAPGRRSAIITMTCTTVKILTMQ